MLPVSASDDVGGNAIQQQQAQQQFIHGQHSRSKGNFSIAAIMGHHMTHESRPFAMEELSPSPPRSIRRSSVDPSPGKINYNLQNGFNEYYSEWLF